MPTQKGTSRIGRSSYLIPYVVLRFGGVVRSTAAALPPRCTAQTRPLPWLSDIIIYANVSRQPAPSQTPISAHVGKDPRHA